MEIQTWATAYRGTEPRQVPLAESREPCTLQAGLGADSVSPVYGETAAKTTALAWRARPTTGILSSEKTTPSTMKRFTSKMTPASTAEHPTPLVLPGLALRPTALSIEIRTTMAPATWTVPARLTEQSWSAEIAW